jgi:polysaccharide deacetylase family protein (PEP-CTERM system associated)
MNAVTFDVEEYFHALNFRAVLPAASGSEPESRVEIGTRRILEILSRAGVHATFFFLGKVARAHPKLVKEVAAQGHEIASHGISHETVHELGQERFRAEARESRSLLEDLSGKEVKGFRASTFSITRSSLWALDILEEEGYGYDSSIFPVIHDRYGIPDFPRSPVRIRKNLVEFPPLTLRLPWMNLPCGGGGYFRLFPLFVTGAAVRSMNRSGLPAILYLHPWEFDPEQPRQRLGGLKTFRHYIHLGKTADRLRKLLKRFAFSRLIDLAGDPEQWEPCPDFA